MQLNLISEEPKQKKDHDFGHSIIPFSKTIDMFCSYVNTSLNLKANIKPRTVEDLGLRWDLIKMEIRGFTVEYTKLKARERRDEEKFLQNRITCNDLLAKAEKNIYNK